MVNKQKRLIWVGLLVGTIILLMELVSPISQTINIDVVEVRDFKVDFIAIDYKTTSFYDTISENTEFLNTTYPLSNDGLKIEINHSPLISNVGPTLEDDELYPLTERIYKSGRLSRSTDRVVGIAPNGWFSDHGRYGSGIAPLMPNTIFPLIKSYKSVIIEEGYIHASAHEIGHTLGLCDEYSLEDWNKLNSSFGGCPNGDLNNDKNLDMACLNFPAGCPTSTIGKLVPWNGSSNFIELKNLMGSSNEPNLRWIDNLSYNRLLNVFSSQFSFITVDYGILVSGTIDKNGNVNIDDYSYILDEQSILNESSGGNFSLIVEENGSTLNKLDFQPEFLVAFIGGNVTEVNVSAFSFVVPFSDNVTNIIIKENNITKDEIIRTPNTPTINITSNLSDKVFYNELFNVYWNASDLDGGNLAYAVLFSADNGSNYTTLEIDYNQTSIQLNSSTLPNCQFCRIKVLVTDGINTNSSVSDAFNNGILLDLHSLTQLYSTPSTERTFGFFITNLNSTTMNNVTWKFNTGESNITSQFTSNLSAGDSKYIVFEYNYSGSGNYTLTATTFSPTASDSESIGVSV